DGSEAMEAAGGVQQYVHGAPALQHPRDHALRFLRARGVDPERERLASRRPDLLRDALDFRLVDVGYGHRRALGREDLRDRLAEPLSRRGYQRDLALQSA